MRFQKLLTTLFCLLSAGVMADEAAKADAAWDVSTPPGERSSVSIDVTSGTWMSLDVSPDGQQIAFDMLGDIYVLPISGGEAKSISSGMAWSMQPRFSPDGSQIAYTSDAGGGDNIWLMDRDGSNARQLTNERFRLLNNPTWSPDGQYVAARKHFTTQRSLGTGEIWLYHVGGGDGVAVVERVSEDHQKELGEPVFSPDGKSIYYSLDSTRGPIFQYAQDSNGQIFQIDRVDLASGEKHAVVTGAGGAVRPQPSPDGRYLAFVRRIRANSALFVKDLESGAVRALYTGLDQDLQEVWAVHGAYPNFDWTPDSSRIVIWAGGKIRSIGVADADVKTIEFKVHDTRDVIAPPRPIVDVAPDRFKSKMTRSAQVSPDGSMLVFETGGKLYTQKLPNGTARRLTSDRGNDFEFFPAFSRDSRHITFVGWSDERLGAIRTVRASGGRSKAVTRKPGHYREPQFSPDGKTIAFSATSGGYLSSPDWSQVTGVMQVAASGGDATLITEDGRYPHFGSSNDRVFVQRRGESGPQLVSINLSGFDERVLASGKDLRRIVISPDERHLAFRENYHVYLMPLPPGGKPVSLSTTASALPLVRVSANGGNFPHFSAQGASINYSLGSTLYQVALANAFTKPDADGNGGFKPPQSGTSMSMEFISDKPQSVVALTGARIITMASEDGGIIEDGVIVVENNRIVAVGKRTSVAIPENAKVLDVAGKTIIPGLIDAHAHGSQGNDIIPQQNWSNYATLALGVTTIHDPSNDATEIFAAAEMQRRGLILAPRLFSTGDIVYGARSAYLANINSAEDALEHIRRLKAQGAMSIKNYNQPRREQRQQVTTAARDENMLVVSEGGSLFHMDLSMVADGNSGIEHNLPQSHLYEDVVQFWSQTKVGYTPTLVVTYGGPTAEHYWYQHSQVWKHPLLSHFVPPHILQPRSVRRQMAPIEDYYHIVSASTAKQLADKGVMVSIGAHGQREGLASHWEIWGFAQGGMSPIQALSTATTQPAKHLGFAQDLGSLEVGKLADLVILDADVSKDIFKSDQVNMVMLNGRLYDAATLNEVLTGERENKPFYWH